MAVVVKGRYAHLSRGRHAAKHMGTGEWADRDSRGNLVLDIDGRWMLSTTDGFHRKSTIYVIVQGGQLVEALGSRSGFQEC